MNLEQSIEVEIFSYQKSAEDLKEYLETCLQDKSKNLKLFVRVPHSRFRTIEPSVLVAVISGISAALGALIAGLLKVAQQSKQRKIIIQSKSGAKIEFPSDLPSDKVDELVEKLKEMDNPRIYL